MSDTTGSCLSHLACARCAATHDADQPANLCPCGGILLARYDLARAARSLSRAALAERSPSLWRYREVLPVRRVENVVELGAGWTPLRPLPGTGAPIEALWMKDESPNPTGSFKARGMAAAVSRMKELGLMRAIVPTAGNAGVALAAYAAAAGIAARIVVPGDAPAGFVQCYRLYGAEVIEVDGTIADAGRVAAEMVRAEGFFDLATLKEPYRAEGKKTMGYELWEQTAGELPDAIVYPTGGGTGLVGMWKAFDELEEMGLLDSRRRRPRLIAVQAAGCAPVVAAVDGGTAVVPWPNAHTFASGLRVPSPYAGPEVLACLAASGGTAIAVDDEAIRSATRALGRLGLGLAPEAGATLAAVPELVRRGALDRDERVVLYFTGSAALYLDVI